METMAQLGVNWLDIVISALLLWGVLRGLRAGFIRRTMSLAGLILGFWGAATWSASVVHLLEERFRVVSSFAGMARQYISIPTEVALIPMQPGGQQEIVNHVLMLPLHPEFKAKIANYMSTLLANMGTIGARTVGEFIYKALASLLLHALAFVVILLVVRGVSVLMAEVLTQIMASGVTSNLTNRLLGAGLGLLETLVLLVALIGLLTPIANVAGGKGLSQVLMDSRIAPVLARMFIWAMGALGGGI